MAGTMALTFPGQGSQAIGMGRAIAEAFATAREVFDEVDQALGQHLFRLMQQGPEDQLTLTQNAQPALMAVSLAVMRVLEKDGGFDLAARARLVAGHSLGEYSALAAAGAFTVADTARLLRTRGEAMQRAVPVGEGAMAALLGASLEQAEEVAREASAAGICTVANDNAPGQVVISGATAAIDRAAEIAKTKGIKRAMRLPVSAPFHCPLMQPAADAMETALAEVTIAPPVVPVLANVTATEVTEPAAIRRLLVQQVTGMVRWRESVLALRALGVDTIVEIGAGKVLTGMAKRIDPELRALSIETPQDAEAFLASL